MGLCINGSTSLGLFPPLAEGEDVVRVCVVAQPSAGLWMPERQWGLSQGLEQRGWGKSGYGPESPRASGASGALLLFSCCHVQLGDPMDCSRPGFLSFTVSWSSLKLMSIGSVMPSSHLILCHPPLLLPSIFLSIRVFSSEPALASGGRRIGASASASVLPRNIQD